MIFFPFQSNEILLAGQVRFCAGQISPRQLFPAGAIIRPKSHNPK
jgi:hypothetical protein